MTCNHIDNYNEAIDGPCPKCLQQRITELEQQLADEKERRSMEAGYAHDAGLESARKGIQEVNIDEDSDPESKGFIEGDVPFCRIHWFEDSGDWSVGIQGYAAWVLDENQEGTGLERMQSKLTEQDRLLDECETWLFWYEKWWNKQSAQAKGPFNYFPVLLTKLREREEE